MNNLNLTIAAFGLTFLFLNVKANPIIDKHKIIFTDSTKTVFIDTVCKMKVKAGSSKRTVYNKVTYYFCAESCMQKFIATPAKYIKK